MDPRRQPVPDVHATTTDLSGPGRPQARVAAARAAGGQSSEPRRYPPPGHFLRHLRLSVDPRTEGTIEGAMPVLPDLCDHTGALRLGAVAAFADYALGVLSTHAGAPDWIATHDLGVQLLGPARGPEVVASGSLVRSGRNTIVSELVIRDLVGTVVGAATATYSRLARVGPTGPTSRVLQRVDLAEADEARRTPLDRYLGFEVDADAGELRFEHLPHLRNSTGAIQGGVIGLAMEWLAAEMAGRALGRPGPGRTLQLQVYYLSQGRKPPFVVRDEVLGRDDGPAGESLHRLELVEAPTGRLLAMGTARASG
ncbi:MAG: hypothetical protein GEV08_05070 [Acidimicrobiia bacterium]|nr:hypothetical protein [Acidimicrobiia bacterium]